MKQDRKRLEDLLLIVLTEYNLDNNIFEETYNILRKNGFTQSQARSVFNNIVPLETLALPLLYLFTRALFKSTKENMINPEKFFTEIEEEEFSKVVVKKESDIKIDGEFIVFDNVLQLRDDQWVLKLSYKQISDLFNEGKIRYNPETQRNLKTKKVDGNIISKININRNSVNEIRKLILKDLFVSNTITLNVLKTGEEGIVYDGKNKTMKISGDLDVIDGFHRSLAILEATRINSNLEGNMIVSLVNFDTSKAQAYIVQEDKKNKISKEHIKYLSQENLENQIVKNLNENVNSELRGLIATDIMLVRNNKSLVMFSTLSEAIKSEFDIKNQRDVRMISEFLIEFFNELIGIKYDDFKDIKKSREKTTIAYNNIFPGYIALASMLFKERRDIVWQDKLEYILKNIDFDLRNEVWKELNILETRQSKRDLNNVINYFKILWKGEVIKS